MSPDEYPPPPSAAPPASLRARVLADAPRLASNLPKPLAVGAVLAVGAGWIVLSASHVGRRDNWSTLPFTASWVVLAEIALVAALSTVVALARGSLMLGPSARRILWSLSAPVVATAIIALLVPNTTPTPSGEFLRYTLVCDAGVMIIGIPVLLLLVYGQHGRILASPGLVGAAAGVAAATWGHVVLHWGCPWTDLGHLILGHAAPSIPLAIGGAVFARWLNRTRPLRD